MKNNHRWATAALLLAAMGFASVSNAALYTSSGSPFDVSLDTGSRSWVENDAALTSSDTTSYGTIHSGNTTNTGPTVDILDPQPGVTGHYRIYTATTTTTYDYDYTHHSQSLSLSYNDYIQGSLVTPESFTFAGAIMAQSGATLIDSNSSLLFNMGIGVGFEDFTAANAVEGSLTFHMGDSNGNWTYAFSTNFDSVVDGISLSNYQMMDFSSPIYFEAIYEVAGADSVPFMLDNIFLNLGSSEGHTTYGPEYNIVETTVETELYYTEIPALPPVVVPVPAAVWLFVSGLIGLISISRRQ